MVPRARRAFHHPVAEGGGGLNAQLRLGLVGAGRWGRNYIRTIAGLPGVRLAALASGNPESASLAGPGCFLTRDWRALMDPARVDAVVIAPPPALHAEMAAAAVRAGLPALVEKPLTPCLEEALALRDLVAGRGGFVMVDHTHLFNPAYRALRREAPRFGPIRAIRSLAGNLGPFRADTGVLWDWGAHDVAMCMDLLGATPDGLEARSVERRETPEGSGEVVEIRATFPGAVTALLTFGNILPKARRLAVHCERAVLVYDDLATHKLTLHPPSDPDARADSPGEPLPYESGMPLACAVREFAAEAAAGSREIGALDFAVEVVRVLSRCDAALAAREASPYHAVRIAGGPEPGAS